jgi:hypothetical protein
MSWSKVNNKHTKPFKWWFHKVLCEFGWMVWSVDGGNTYYYQLKKLCKLGFNIYGDKI